MSTNRPQLGFNIIEVMVVIGILALLTTFSFPMYRSWLQNSQLRASAEGIAAALQHARSEAVRLNATTGVRFVMAGNDWRVEQVSTGAVLQQGGGVNLAENAVVTTTPAANTTVVFTPLGGVAPTGFTVDFDVTHVNAGGPDPTLKCTADGGEMRCLRVQVRGGGMVRMCDPSVTTVGDPRLCLP